jgi:tetratricopeptide (TPR) repeat protein
LTGIGDALMQQKDPRAALKSYQRGVTVLEKAVGLDHPDLAEGLTGLGLARLELGAGKDAVVLIERALKIRQAAGGDPLDLARTQFALARALRASGGDPERARTLAESARDAYAKNEGAKAETAAVRDWLSQR